MIRNLTLAAVLMAPVSVMAQDLPTAPYLPLDMSLAAAQTALDACSAEGHNVSVAIAARSGETKVLLRADNAGPHTINSSIGKAFTSASMGRDTASLAGFIGGNPGNDGMHNMDARMVVQAGGLPIRINGELVGGIGVGGAPSGDIDASCARAGLDEIGAE